MIGPLRYEFARKLQAALGIDPDAKCTSIDLHFGVDEIATATVTWYVEDGELEEMVRVLEDFKIGDKMKDRKPPEDDMVITDIEVEQELETKGGKVQLKISPKRIVIERRKGDSDA